MTSTQLPDPDTNRALDAVTRGARTTNRQRRWVIAGAAAAVAVVAAVAVLAPRLDDDRRPTPAPAPDDDATRIIEQGNLSVTVDSRSPYGVDAAGNVLTVWSSCGERTSAPDCGTAWQLGTGAEPWAAGLARGRREDFAREVDLSEVYPAGSGFVISEYNQPAAIFVASDGTATELTQTECRGWPTEPAPGRYVLAEGLLGPKLVDTVGGTWCNTFSFDARSLSGGAYSPDGTVWVIDAGAEKENGRYERAAVGWYDGSEWRYRDLSSVRMKFVHTTSTIAVGETATAVLIGRDGPPGESFTMTSNDGATWESLNKADLPFAGHDYSMAFAGSDALFVADQEGTLWMTQLTGPPAFSRVDTSGPISHLQPAGDAVIARSGGPRSNDLVLISGDGSIEPLVIRGDR